jgi:predicted NBD/HSP70 family sugar kinase
MMPLTKPSSGLLRELTDENVLTALMGDTQLTRAELAKTTGLSKPTVAESVRRLEHAGLVVDTGHRTHTRGGVGTYYALAAEVGVALAMSVAPDGVTGEIIDARGSSLAILEKPVTRPAIPTTLKRLLAATAKTVMNGYGPAMVRAAVVSAADPVDRVTGALVHLPDAPFLLGALSPADTLRDLVTGPVVVDNDVNWAARCERDARNATAGPALDDFVYLYLGEGLGCAVVSDGQVRRGHGGLVGEIAHVLTVGPDGRAMPFIEVFERLGLRHGGTTAIDISRLHERLSAPEGEELAQQLARAVGGVISAAVAFSDPSVIVLGGAWGTMDVVARTVVAQAGQLARPIAVEQAHVIDRPALAGARAAAVELLRNDLLHRARGQAFQDSPTT